MRSKSGRIVLEIDPVLKHRLHARLASDGQTLKGWFLERAEAYLADAEAVQLELPVRLEFPIFSLHPGLRPRGVAPDVWPTRSRDGRRPSPGLHPRGARLAQQLMVQGAA